MRFQYELLRAALDAVEEGVLIINQVGEITYYNQQFINIWNIPLKLLAAQEHEQIIQFAAAQLIDPQTFLTKTIPFNVKPDLELQDELLFIDGKILERRLRPHRINKKIIGRIISFRDITASKHHDIELLQQATHDELTGLPNRHALQESLHQAIGYANRTNLLFSILFLDIDHYKVVNDSFGHSLGDVLLREVGLRLQSCIRENDILVRFGGDEFLIVATTLQRKQDVVPVAEKILAALSQPFICEGQELKITVSIGVALYSAAVQNPQELIKQADEAMYCAKRRGRNNFCFYDNC